jgi:hypothetical protein
MVDLFSISVRWYYKRFTKDQVTRKVCWEWMWKDRPSDGAIHTVYLVSRELRVLLSFPCYLLIAWSAYTVQVFRQSESWDWKVRKSWLGRSGGVLILFLLLSCQIWTNSLLLKECSCSLRWMMTSGTTGNLKLGFTHFRYYRSDTAVLFVISLSRVITVYSTKCLKQVFWCFS